MKKLVSFLFLIGSIAHADIGAFFTYPEGDNGEVQFNGDGVFEGDPQMTFSTTTNRLSVDSIYVSSIVFRADGSTQTISGGGGGLTIGDAVSGGTSGAVLYNDASGNLGNDSLFTFSTPTKTLSIGGPTWDALPTMMTIKNTIPSYGAVFLSDDWATLSSGQAIAISPVLNSVGIAAYFSGGTPGNQSELSFRSGSLSSTSKMILGSQTTPLNPLEVSGEAIIGTGYAGVETAPANGLLVEGNVGIGTASPGSKLTVSNGDIKISTTTGSRGIIFQDGTTQNTAASGASIGGTVTSGTTGSVLFVGASSALTQDNSSLFFDDTNNRLGIGTASPAAKLTVYGSPTHLLFDSSAGPDHHYIDFGTAGSAEQSIHYTNTSSISPSGEQSGIDISGSTKFVKASPYRMGVGTLAPGSQLTVVGSSQAVGAFQVGSTSSTYALLVTTTDLVGIGTGSPSTKLHVSSGVLTINGTGAGLNVVGTSSATYFVGDGSLLTNLPAGVGDMVLASTQTVTAAKTFSAPTVFNSSVSITNTGTTNGFSMQQIGNTPVTAGAFGTGRGGLYFDNTQNTGIGLHLYTNQASAAGFGALARMHCANSAFAQPCLHIVQDGTSGAAAGIRLDGVSPQIEFVETDQVAPAGKYEFQIQGDLGFINGRNSGDSSFEDLWKFARVGLGYTNGGYVANMQAVRYRFYDLDSSNYVSFRASDTVASNVAFIWPAADGSSGQALITNGSGALSFGTVAGSSDNLGNHTATTTLNMAGFGIINVASVTMTPSAIVQSSTFTTQTFITSPDGGVTNSTWTLYTTSATLAQGGNTTVATYLGSDIDLSGAEATGVLAAGRFPALTGDVTTSAGALATTIASTVPGVHFFSGATLNTSTAGITVQGAATSSLSSAVSVLSTAPANGTAGGGLVYIGRQGTTALSSGQLGQIVFVGGDSSIANGAGATINAKAGGTWNSGSHRTHLTFGTAITNSIDSESYDLGIQDTGQVTIGTTTISAGVPAGTGLLTLGARGDMPALAMTGIAGEPTGLVSGSIYYNTSQKAIRYMVQGTSETFTGSLWTKTVPSTVTATTTETDLLGTGFGTLLLPANFWVAGKSIRVHLEGLISDDAAAPGTHTFAAKLDAVVISSSAANTPAVGLTNKHWDMDVTLTCRSTGASGKVVGAGSFSYENTLSAGYWGLIKTEATIATVDTTQADTLAVTLTNGTNDADNIFVTQAATVEVLN